MLIEMCKGRGSRTSGLKRGWSLVRGPYLKFERKCFKTSDLKRGVQAAIAALWNVSVAPLDPCGKC